MDYCKLHPIPNYPDYLINLSGEIWSLKKKKYLKPYKSDGYLRVCLYSNNKCKTVSIHRLLASVFIPTLKNKPQVNHKNGIRDDNRIGNLYWGTSSENAKDSVRHGTLNLLSKENQRHTRAKLSIEDVRFIKAFPKKFGNASYLAKMFRVTPQMVAGIVRGAHWKNVSIN